MKISLQHIGIWPNNHEAKIQRLIGRIANKRAIQSLEVYIDDTLKDVDDEYYILLRANKDNSSTVISQGHTYESAIYKALNVLNRKLSNRNLDKVFMIKAAQNIERISA